MLQEKSEKQFESNLIVGGTKEDRKKAVTEMAKKIFGVDQIEKLTGIDYFLVEKLADKSGVVIEQIRELQNKLSKRPFLAKNKVAVILEIGNANLQTQNCLLKTLEEPPANSILFLTAQDPESVIPTVKSRCRVVTLISDSLKTSSPMEEKWKPIFEEIISSERGKRLNWTDKNKVLFENREEIIEMLDYFILRLRKNLLESHEKKNAISAIEELLFFKKSISTVSVNLRIAVENLFLSLPIINTDLT